MKCTSQSFTTSLTDLLMLLQDFRFSNDQDQRALIHGKKFLKSSKGIIMHEEDECDHADLIWRSRCPNKLKIFAWLLFRGRLNTRDSLFHKHIAVATACPRCNATSEGTQHLFIACPRAASIWLRLGTVLPARFQDLWATSTPADLWNLHLARDSSTDSMEDMGLLTVFRNKNHSKSTAVRSICSDFELWTHRFKEPSDKMAAQSQLSHLTDIRGLVTSL